jgi:hypothetical protein
MADLEILLDRNDMLARVTVTDKSTGLGIDTATTKTITLYDVHEKEVKGETWPVTLSSKGSGVWEATITREISTDESGNVKVGDLLIMEVDVDGGAGKRFFMRKRVEVKERS